LSRDVARLALKQPFSAVLLTLSSAMPNDVTRILQAMADADRRAADDLLPIVYNELRRMAARKMAGEKPGQTLNATALVHEAYLRLVASDGAEEGKWDGRRHFFAAAAEAMRRILVESARRKSRVKHGGELNRVPLKEDAVVSTPTDGALRSAVLDCRAEGTVLHGAKRRKIGREPHRQRGTDP
jgi:RNA polymerase sigma factor (TIGR02999 family)